jgi:hypothetical protein
MKKRERTQILFVLATNVGQESSCRKLSETGKILHASIQFSVADNSREYLKYPTSFFDYFHFFSLLSTFCFHACPLVGWAEGKFLSACGWHIRRFYDFFWRFNTFCLLSREEKIYSRRFRRMWRSFLKFKWNNGKDLLHLWPSGVEDFSLGGISSPNVTKT